MPTSVQYVVLSYTPGMSSTDRIWHGTDEVEAKRQLAIMQQKYPGAAVRYTVHQYFKPIEEKES